jgi:type II secretory pathway component PulJ
MSAPGSCRGFTIVELAVASFLAMVVLLGMGTVYLVVQNSFRVGAKKVVAQQEATLLSQFVSRQVRLGDALYVYRQPDRITPQPTGDGLAILDEDGAPIMRFEYDADTGTLADSLGVSVSAMTVRNLEFSVDPLRPRTVVFEFATDDEHGNLVDVESSATLRN